MTDPPLLALTRRRRLPRSGEDAASAADTENMRQLVQLRWLAVVGQLVTILVVAFAIQVPLPLAPMLALVAVSIMFNLAAVPLLRRRQVRHLELLLALLFDVGSLSVQLYLSGGATNPFVALYLLQVVLGAILLERWASWVIVGVTALCVATLVRYHLPLRYPPDLVPVEGGLYTLGLWLCFALVAVLLVLFVTRIVQNLRARDARLADMRQQASEEDHLVRLGLFASGAAHELGTPLATLSVILSDWRRMPRLARDPELGGEIAEMQAQVQRCKTIVTDVLQSVGELPGALPEQVGARAFLADIVRRWRALHPDTLLAFRDRLDGALAIAADPSLRQAIWNVLDNAAEASPGEVELVAEADDDMLRLIVRDRGHGFSEAMLADFGKPLRSGKGSGHGVGLFLVAGVVRKLGGTVAAANRSEGGAEVVIALPLATIGLSEAANVRPEARDRRG